MADSPTLIRYVRDAEKVRAIEQALRTTMRRLGLTSDAVACRAHGIVDASS